MNLERMLAGLAVLVAVLVTIPHASADPPGWSHTFDDNTFDGMVAWDYASWQTGGAIVTFFPATVNPCPTCSPALRFAFNSPIDRAVGLFSDSSMTFSTASGGASAKVLIKFSTNPYTFASPGQNTYFVAVAVNMDPQFSSDLSGAHFKGYWVYVGDKGGNPAANPPASNQLDMAIQYLDPAGAHDLSFCQAVGDIGYSKSFNPFDATKDWWVRAEALGDGLGNVIIRGRTWPNDGTPEPDTWDVRCTDTTFKYTSGIVGVGAEQRYAYNGIHYIDLDNVSARIPLDSYCPDHCTDPACANHADCQCNIPFADAQGSAGVGKGFGDGDVDVDDFAVFQICYTGPGGVIPAEPVYCACFDRPEPGFPKGNGSIDATDFTAFMACATGPSIPWAPSAGCLK